MADAIGLYNEIYEAYENPPLYAAPWWLNATCGATGWDVFSQKNEDGRVTSLIPYGRTKIRGLNAIITPPLTQWLPVLSPDQEPHYSLVDFIRSLPKGPILDIALKPVPDTFLDNQPFQIHFKYSYIIQGQDKAFNFKSGYNEGLRRNLREAEKIYDITISDDIKTFLSLCHSSYTQRNMNEPAWVNTIAPRVINALWDHKAGQLLLAQYKGEAIAGVLTGWDGNATYYLLGGRRNTDHGISAHAVLLDRAITEAMQRRHNFDFEGSMQPGIANFFQSFGGIPEPYWHIRKFRGPGKLWAIFH